MSNRVPFWNLLEPDKSTIETSVKPVIPVVEFQPPRFSAPADPAACELKIIICVESFE